MSMHKISLSLMALVCFFKLANSQSLSAQGDEQTLRFREGHEAFIECHLNGAVNQDGFNWSGPAVTDENIQNGIVTIKNSGTVSTLTFKIVEGDDEGTYVCTHSSVSGDGLHFTVSVLRNPIFITQEVNYSAFEGGDVVLTCQVKYCTPYQSCQTGLRWRRGVASIPSTTTINGDITTITTTLTNVQQEDSGIYMCRFSSSGQLDFTLTINPPSERVPMLDKSIENQYQEFYYDKPLILVCPVRSGENSTENPMNISWIFTNIHEQEQFVTGTVLTLPMGCFNQGTYKCSATNNFGSDSLDIFVEINAPPLPAELDLPTLTVTDGDQHAILTVEWPTSPVARSSLEYHWEKLIEEQWNPLSYSTGKYSKMHNGYLTINNITLMDAGSYRVTISNDFGESVQTRQVDVSPKPTEGMPVAIGFTFTLPESISCAHVKENRDLLTEYLSNYLSTLCLNTTAMPTACEDIVVQDVTVECPGASKQGAFRARMRSSSHAKHTAKVFENNGPTRLNQHINIEPCGDGQCVLPTEAIETLQNLVIVLVIVVMVLVIVVIVTIVIVICVLKHKNCTRNCRVTDIESNRPKVQRSFSSPATVPHDTLGQIKQQNHYFNC